MDPSTQADAQTLGRPSKHDWKLGCLEGSGGHTLVAKSAAFEAPQAAPSKHTVVIAINPSGSSYWIRISDYILPLVTRWNRRQLRSKEAL
jgi:hypothetical protein